MKWDEAALWKKVDRGDVSNSYTIIQYYKEM